MDICEKCFNSYIISDHIKTHGKRLNRITQCSNCQNRTQFRYEEYQLRLEIQKTIKKFYEHEWEHGLVGSASMMAKPEKDDFSLYLPGLMSLNDICYELFQIDCEEKFYEFLKDYETDGQSEFDQSPYEETWLNIRCKWEGSDDIQLEWNTFCENVKHGARFFDHNNYSRIQELSKLNNTFETLSIQSNSNLFRARKIENEANIIDITNNPAKELGKAPKESAGLNRFSPQGISYVYLSKEKETVCKEIRLNSNESYAIAEFEITNLKLIDLRLKNLESIHKNIFSEKHTSELRCSIEYIKDFLWNISQPINDDEKYLDYVPTQIVAEYIWSLDYDGFIYDSSLCDGENYLLFDEKYELIKYEIVKKF